MSSRSQDSISGGEVDLRRVQLRVAEGHIARLRTTVRTLRDALLEALQSSGRLDLVDGVTSAAATAKCPATKSSGTQSSQAKEEQSSPADAGSESNEAKLSNSSTVSNGNGDDDRSVQAGSSKPAIDITSKPPACPTREEGSSSSSSHSSGAGPTSVTQSKPRSGSKISGSGGSRPEKHESDTGKWSSHAPEGETSRSRSTGSSSPPRPASSPQQLLLPDAGRDHVLASALQMAEAVLAGPGFTALSQRVRQASSSSSSSAGAAISASAAAAAADTAASGTPRSRTARIARPSLGLPHASILSTTSSDSGNSARQEVVPQPTVAHAASTSAHPSTGSDESDSTNSGKRARYAREWHKQPLASDAARQAHGAAAASPGAKRSRPAAAVGGVLSAHQFHASRQSAFWLDATAQGSSHIGTGVLGTRSSGSVSSRERGPPSVTHAHFGLHPGLAPGAHSQAADTLSAAPAPHHFAPYARHPSLATSTSSALSSSSASLPAAGAEGRASLYGPDGRLRCSSASSFAGHLVHGHALAPGAILVPSGPGQHPQYVYVMPAASTASSSTTSGTLLTTSPSPQVDHRRTLVSTASSSSSSFSSGTAKPLGPSPATQSRRPQRRAAVAAAEALQKATMHESAEADAIAMVSNEERQWYAHPSSPQDLPGPRSPPFVTVSAAVAASAAAEAGSGTPPPITASAGATLLPGAVYDSRELATPAHLPGRPRRSTAGVWRKGKLDNSERARVEFLIQAILSEQLIVYRGELSRQLREFVNPNRSQTFYEKLISRRKLNRTLGPLLKQRRTVIEVPERPILPQQHALPQSAAPPNVRHPGPVQAVGSFPAQLHVQHAGVPPPVSGFPALHHRPHHRPHHAAFAHVPAHQHAAVHPPFASVPRTAVGTGTAVSTNSSAQAVGVPVQHGMRLAMPARPPYA